MSEFHYNSTNSSSAFNGSQDAFHFANALHSGLNYSIKNFTNSSFIQLKNNTNLPSEPYTKAQILAAFYVTWVFYPILLTCCTIGSIINLIVLTREQPKGSTNTYMVTMSISDLFVLWSFLPVYVYNITPAKKRSPAFLKSFKEYQGLQRWGEETSIQLCDWTLIVFSLVRLLAIIRPFNYRWLQTVRTARITSICLLILAGLFTLYNVVESYYFYVNGVTANTAPAWLTNWEQTQHQAEVGMTIFKFFALLVINLFVVMAIRRHKQSDIGKMRAGQQSNSNRKYRNSNIILLGSVVVYLTTQLPSLIMNCLMIAADNYHTFNLPVSVRQFANPFITMSFLTNYSVNFLLYVTVSKRFRAQFAQIFAPEYFRKMIKRNLTSRRKSSVDDLDKEPVEVPLSTLSINDGRTPRSTKKKSLQRTNPTSVKKH